MKRFLLCTFICALCFGIGGAFAQQPPDRMTPPDKQLLSAASSDDVAAIQSSLQQGANIEVRDNFGYTPLLIVASSSWVGNTGALTLLLERGANIEAKDNLGETPLILAASRGNPGTLNMLLEKGANIEATDNAGHTPLIGAADQGNTGALALLLEKGANIEAKDHAGDTPLIEAAGQGRTGALTLLLQRGANIEDKNSDGDTPLIAAAVNGETDALTLLLDRGANIEVKNNDGNTALIEAVKRGKNEALALLLKRGANIEATNNDGDTALIMAVSPSLGNVATIGSIQLLLDKGADVGARNSCGETPLIATLSTLSTVDAQSSAIATLLLNKGANVNAIANVQGQYCMVYGNTPLMEASSDELIETAKVLLDKGAKTDIRDGNGQTALIYAVKTCKPNTIKLLLERGADPSAPDSAGDTPLNYAKAICGKTPQVIDLLQTAHRSPRQELEEMATEWPRHLCSLSAADDAQCGPLLKSIIALDGELTPPPAIPEDARKSFVEGATLMQEGHVYDAQQDFTHAIDLAPWWANAYYNGAVAAEKDEDFQLAQNLLQKYLLFPLSEADARDARDRLYAIEAEKKGLKQDQENFLREAAAKYVKGGAQRVLEDGAPQSWKPSGGYGSQDLYAYRQKFGRIDRYFQNVFLFPGDHYLAIDLEAIPTGSGTSVTDKILLIEMLTDGRAVAHEYPFGMLDGRFLTTTGLALQVSISDRREDGVVSVTDPQSGAGVVLPLADLYTARYTNTVGQMDTSYAKLGIGNYWVGVEGGTMEDGRGLAYFGFFDDKLDAGNADPLSLIPTYVVEMGHDTPIADTGYFIRYHGDTWKVEK